MNSKPHIAEAFKLFQAGTTLDQVVVALNVEPEEIERLYHGYLKLCAIEAAKQEAIAQQEASRKRLEEHDARLKAQIEARRKEQS